MPRACVLACAMLCGMAAAPSGAEEPSWAELIDGHIQARLDAAGVARVPLAEDAEFLRRVYLDVHGVVPPASEAARFLDSPDPVKRSRLIDQLLADSRFGEHLADEWRRRLISPLANEIRMQPDRFAAWLAERFNSHAAWDRIVFELLTAEGTMEQNPAVTYLIEGRHPLGVTDLTDLTSRYFLGVRLNCAQCHDHPFVAWTRRDYWGMAAFFAQIQTPGRPKLVHLAGVRDDPRMTLAALAGQDMIEGFLHQPPTFLGGARLPEGETAVYRRALAQWMTSPENPYFARAAVNRTWWKLFGRGLVHPVDDMHFANPPSHPELLEALADRFTASGFDLRALYRGILNSRTYQQTSRPGEQPDREAELFARMPIKVLTAEQLYDSLVRVLGPPARAKEVNTRLGARHEFTQFFADGGDPDPTRYERGIPHLLRLMNSPQFGGRNVAALVAQAAGPGRSADDVVDELFLAILSRRPAAAERELARDHLRQAGRSTEGACLELAWALLMSSEFSLNH
jgi:hypothetical protein